MREGESSMWESETETVTTHDRPCPSCGHAVHQYLPCDKCDCQPPAPPGH